MLPLEIVQAASRGDLETIRAYFEDDSDGARHVDDHRHHPGLTPLILCAGGNSDDLTLAHVNVARYLLSRGASIYSHNNHGFTALSKACYCKRGAVPEMVNLLLSAGADANSRNSFNRTPLGAHIRFSRSPSLAVVTALLRYGASLDRCFEDSPIEALYRSPQSALDVADGFTFEELPAIKTLIAGVRRAGSFKRYVREPHRKVLALRGLAMRGHLAPRGTRRTRGAQKWKAAVAFLARQGDNGVVWNVLSFWRATK